MKNLLYLLFILTILGCSSNDDSLDNAPQTFRSINSNTFWYSNDGTILAFSNDKLFSIVTEQDICYYWKEGSYDNVYYDECTRHNVTYSFIEETSDQLVFKEVVSDGEDGSGSNCEGGVTAFSFELLNDDMITLTLTSDDGTNTISLEKKIVLFH